MQLRLPSVPVRWVLALLLLVGALAWFTAPNPEPLEDESDPFVGRWLVNGTDAFGSEYSGSLTIRAEGTLYEVEWIITGALVSGAGMLDGEVLSVEWESSAAGRQSSGSAEYRLEEGVLSGVIRPDGVEATGVESGERLPG